MARGNEPSPMPIQFFRLALGVSPGILGMPHSLIRACPGPRRVPGCSIGKRSETLLQHRVSLALKLVRIALTDWSVVFVAIRFSLCAPILAGRDPRVNVAIKMEHGVESRLISISFRLPSGSCPVSHEFGRPSQP